MVAITARSVAYQFTGNFKNLTAGLTAAGKSVNDFGGKLTALDKNGAQMREGLTSLGSVAGKFALGAAAGLGLAAKEAAGFESAMTRIQVLAGVAGGEIDALSEDIRSLGSEYGVSATEAADAFFFLVSGIGDTAVATEALDAALKGAAVGLGTVEDISSSITSAIAGYGKEVIGAAEVTDILGAAAQKAVLAPDELAKGLTRVIPAAAQMGVSFEDLAATMALISPAFDSASEAGTSIQAVFTALNRAAPESAAALGKVGLTFEELRETAAEQGLSGALLQLGEAFDGNVEGLTRVLGSTEAARAAMALMGRDSADVAGSLEAVANAAGFVDGAFAEVEQTAGFKTQKALAEVRNALIGIGDAVLPMVAGVTDGVAKIASAFDSLPGPMKTATAGLLGITAIVGGSLWFGAKVVGGIAATNVALANLGVTARVTAASLAAVAKSALLIAAPVVAGVVVLKALKEATKGVDEAFRSLDEAIASGSLAQSESMFANARKEAEKLREEMEQAIGFAPITDDGDQVSAAFLGIKNAIEGALGDSDVEERNAKLDTFRTRLDGLADSAVAVADAMGMTIGPVDGSDASFAELDRVMSEAAPTMEKLRITSGDLALAQKVASGEATSFERILASQKPTFDELIASIYGATSGNAELDEATEKAAAAAEKQAAASKAQADALAAVRGAARDSASAFFDFSLGADEAATSLGEWLTQLEDQARALRNFTQNTIEAGEKGISQGLIDHLRELGPEGAKQMEWLANATEKEIGRANADFKSYERGLRDLADVTAGVPALNVRVQDKEGRERIAAIQKLMDKFGMTKAEAKAFIKDAATDEITAIQTLMDQYGITKAQATALLKDLASGDIASIRQKLRDLDAEPEVVLTVRTNHINSYSNAANDPSAPVARRAAGGLITGPGGPRDDKIPALLSNREYVVQASAVEHYGVGVMNSINAKRFAGGGLVSGGGGNDKSWPDLDHVARGLKALTKSLDKATTAFSDAKSERQAIISAVSANFLSDPFAASAASSNIFASGATAGGVDVLGALRGDNRDALEYQALIDRFTKGKRGLSGSALAEADTLEEALALKDLGRDGRRKYQQLFDRRESLAQSAGAANANGSAATVAELRELRQEVRGLRKDVRAEEKKARDNADKNAKVSADAVTGAGRDSQRRSNHGGVDRP